MRAVNCIVCESHRKTVLEEQKFKDDYLDLISPDYQCGLRRLVICNDCGFVYHDPQLDDRDMATLYDKFRDVSFRNESPDAYFDRITLLPKDQSENFAKVEWIRNRLPDFMSKGGRLLDIGCGGGVFIHTFLQNSPKWTAAGVEPTPAFADLAGRRLNQPVVSGSYHPGLFAAASFDLITINQVLEHVSDPVAFLEAVRNDLAEGGYIYLEVPDVLDLEFLPPNHDRFLMQHLWVFSKASLTNVCRRARYEVVDIEQQVSVRQKRNLVAVLSPSALPRQDELVRDDSEWVLSLREQYYKRPFK